MERMECMECMECMETGLGAVGVRRSPSAAPRSACGNRVEVDVSSCSARSKLF
jgi:hypothetical protein